MTTHKTDDKYNAGCDPEMGCTVPIYGKPPPTEAGASGG